MSGHIKKNKTWGRAIAKKEAKKEAKAKNKGKMKGGGSTTVLASSIVDQASQMDVGTEWAKAEGGVA